VGGAAACVLGGALSRCRASDAGGLHGGVATAHESHNAVPARTLRKLFSVAVEGTCELGRRTVCN